MGNIHLLILVYLFILYPYKTIIAIRLLGLLFGFGLTQIQNKTALVLQRDNKYMISLTPFKRSFSHKVTAWWWWENIRMMSCFVTVFRLIWGYGEECVCASLTAAGVTARAQNLVRKKGCDQLSTSLHTHTVHVWFRHTINVWLITLMLNLKGTREINRAVSLFLPLNASKKYCIILQ